MPRLTRFRSTNTAQKSFTLVPVGPLSTKSPGDFQKVQSASD